MIKQFHDEDFIEELKSLSVETKDHEAISQALFGQIMNILNEVLEVNDNFKSYTNDVKEIIDQLEVELKDAENKEQEVLNLYRKIKPKLWKRALKFGSTGLGTFISPEMAIYYAIAAILFLLEDCNRCKNATKQLILANVATELIKNKQELKDEKAGSIKDLSVLIEALSEISASLTKYYKKRK
ncbi:14491_t:CDS:2 [Dentiscutata heterogama]|uniref:14491_t:CDS:1 n=1 Tax=Dentiscutata heterogama TaxID=1316150 RepID=A0ACA9N840_9GLOM|nr:14491_t:CDS:2 [Dentiscutata heterogama]